MYPSNVSYRVQSSSGGISFEFSRSYRLLIPSNMTSGVFFGFALLLAFLAAATTNVSAGIAELLNDVEDPTLTSGHASIMTNSLQTDLEGRDAGSPCHIEYQVTKRKIGHCVKLGHGVRGCVSGTYLNPFHPDCV